MKLVRAKVYSFLVLEYVAPCLARGTERRQPVRRWCVNIDRGSLSLISWRGLCQHRPQGLKHLAVWPARSEHTLPRQQTAAFSKSYGEATWAQTQKRTTVGQTRRSQIQKMRVLLAVALLVVGCSQCSAWMTAPMLSMQTAKIRAQTSGICVPQNQRRRFGSSILGLKVEPLPTRTDRLYEYLDPSPLCE